MALLLLQLANEMADKALQVNPWNALGYGALVFVLSTIAWIQYKERLRMQEKYVEHVEKHTSLLVMVESKMEVFNEVRSKLEIIQGIIQNNNYKL